MKTIYYMIVKLGAGHTLYGVNEEFKPLREKAIQYAKIKYGEFEIGLDNETEIGISKHLGRSSLFDVYVGFIGLNDMKDIDSLIEVAELMRR